MHRSHRGCRCRGDGDGNQPGVVSAEQRHVQDGACGVLDCGRQQDVRVVQILMLGEVLAEIVELERLSKRQRTPWRWREWRKMIAAARTVRTFSQRGDTDQNKLWRLKRAARTSRW